MIITNYKHRNQLKHLILQMCYRNRNRNRNRYQNRNRNRYQNRNRYRNQNHNKLNLDNIFQVNVIYKKRKWNTMEMEYNENGIQ